MIIGIYKGTFAPFTYGNLQVVELISQFISQKENDDFEIWIQLEKQEKVEEKFKKLYTEEEMKFDSEKHNLLNYLSPNTYNWTRRILTIAFMLNFSELSEKIKIIEEPTESIDLIQKAIDKTNRRVYWISSSKINQYNEQDDPEHRAIKELYSNEKIVDISVDNLSNPDSRSGDSLRRDLETLSLSERSDPTIIERIKGALQYVEIFNFLTCRISVISSVNNQQSTYFIKLLQLTSGSSLKILHLRDYYYPDKYHHKTKILDNQNNFISDCRHPETIDQTQLFNDILLYSSKYKAIVIEGSQALELPGLLDIAVEVHLIKYDVNKAKFDLWKSLKHSQNQEEWMRFSKYWENYVLPRLRKTSQIYDAMSDDKKIF